MAPSFDVAVVGGGVVGLATAREFRRIHPTRSVILIEKEPRFAAHQTGHNSGVIHSGLYYKPGSSKARTAVRGAELLKQFCRDEGVRFEICGKVVVATKESEIPALEELQRRGTANGVPDLAVIGPERLREIEPAATGLRALHVPHAGIIDYAEVCAALGRQFQASGGVVQLSTRVRAVREDGDGLVLETTGNEVRCRRWITCAGLHSDRVARLDGGDPAARIVPFRGEYYELAPERHSLVRALIYPVPDARFPFLGVHFTRMIGGGVEAGPNAVLAYAREGYRKFDINLRDLAGTLLYPAFWKMAAKYWKTGFGEIVRSYSKRAFVKALQALVPEIRECDVKPGGSGVRAQALDRSGALVDDFRIVESARGLHVVNAPSPAATASLSIAAEIVRQADAHFAFESRT